MLLNTDHFGELISLASSGCLLMQMYLSFGAMEEARVCFERMTERNVFYFNIMIAAYARRGEGREAIRFFEHMQQEAVIPDKITYVHILSAFCSQIVLVKGKRIHACITHCGFESDVVLSTAIVSMYGRCNSLMDAQKMFGSMSTQNVVSWNAMLAAYAQHGHSKKALCLFKQMQQEGVIPTRVTFVSTLDACARQTDWFDGMQILTQITQSGFEYEIVVATAIINMYGKCGSVENAWAVFNRIPKRNLVSWNAMISVYAQNEHGKKAHLLYDQMQQEGIAPDKFTFISVLLAYASLAALTEGKGLHDRIIQRGDDSDLVVATSLTNMYARCGNLENARWTFDKMPEKDVVSWTAMIGAYAQHGRGEEALQLFDGMKQEGVVPDNVTYVSALTACSHAGLVCEGHRCWVSMYHEYGITPSAEHYACMVDLLGRVGQLDEAEHLLNNIEFKATAVSWMTLLGACRNLVDVNRGEHAANHVFELDPNNASPYVMLSNIYIEAGRKDDAEKVLDMMRMKGLKLQAGCSLIEVLGKGHEFSVHDQLLAQRDEIYAELQWLSKQMEEAGYVPDLRWPLACSEEEQHKLCFPN